MLALLRKVMPALFESFNQNEQKMNNNIELFKRRCYNEGVEEGEVVAKG